MRARIGLALVVVLTACTSTPSPIGTRDLLDGVKPGASRAEIVLKLGPPFARFEGERILTWSIGQDAGGYFLGAGHCSPAASRQFLRYELVVVFDSNGKVAKHSLVEVHQPQ